MITFHHNNQQLTAGQALDVWLASEACKNVEPKMLSSNIHVFADAVYGYPRDMAVVARGGVQILFGEPK